MAMDVEQSDSSVELQGAGDSKLWTPCNPVLQVDPILAHYVVHDKRNWDVLHIVGECLAKAIVHIDLPIGPD